CLLNPISWPEPFGMVMIEALACGTPVVATPLGAAPEIVDDGVTGFLRSDERSLVTALAQVGDLDRGACRRVAEERCSAGRFGADHLALDRQAMGGGPGWVTQVRSWVVGWGVARAAGPGTDGPAGLRRAGTPRSASGGPGARPRGRVAPRRRSRP